MLLTFNIVDIIVYWQAGKLWVQGEGHVHAVHVNITAENVVVDDLGHIIGDHHGIACTIGDGFDSVNGASGRVIWKFSCLFKIRKKGGMVHLFLYECYLLSHVKSKEFLILIIFSITTKQISTKFGRNVREIILYQICVFCADGEFNMVARANYVV